MIDHIGVDVGSTTVKIVVLDENFREKYSDYKRHKSKIRDTIHEMLDAYIKYVKANKNVDENEWRCSVGITGSGGIRFAEELELGFIQEVVAETKAIKKEYPITDVVIELGGEDAKIIFLKNGIEQRMNGICAGGTGAFIDQMASLLNTDAKGLNEYAISAKHIYPIAARCGVFAKTDIQPLINDGVSRNDIATSIFQAVVNQTISGLACGRKIEGHVAFLGGPLYFLSELRNAFIKTLNLSEKEIIFPHNAHLYAATGAAIYFADESNGALMLVKQFEDLVRNITMLFLKVIDWNQYLQAMKNMRSFVKGKKII